MRSLLFELKEYGYDFFEPESSGCLMVSHVILSHLPKNFCKELVHLVGTNYPDVNMIFEHYNDILKTLTAWQSVSFKRADVESQETQIKKNQSFKSNYSSVPALQNFALNAHPSPPPFEVESVSVFGAGSRPINVESVAPSNKCSVSASSSKSSR